jgi:hypothetical protein
MPESPFPIKGDCLLVTYILLYPNSQRYFNATDIQAPKKSMECDHSGCQPGLAQVSHKTQNEYNPWWPKSAPVEDGKLINIQATQLKPGEDHHL